MKFLLPSSRSVICIRRVFMAENEIMGGSVRRQAATGHDGPAIEQPKSFIFRPLERWLFTDYRDKLWHQFIYWTPFPLPPAWPLPFEWLGVGPINHDRINFSNNFLLSFPWNSSGVINTSVRFHSPSSRPSVQMTSHFSDVPQLLASRLPGSAEKRN